MARVGATEQHRHRYIQPSGQPCQCRQAARGLRILDFRQASPSRSRPCQPTPRRTIRRCDVASGPAGQSRPRDRCRSSRRRKLPAARAPDHRYRARLPDRCLSRSKFSATIYRCWTFAAAAPRASSRSAPSRHCANRTAGRLRNGWWRHSGLLIGFPVESARIRRVGSGRPICALTGSPSCQIAVR